MLDRVAEALEKRQVQTIHRAEFVENSNHYGHGESYYGDCYGEGECYGEEDLSYDSDYYYGEGNLYGD